MKRKILFIIVASLLTAYALAIPQRTIIAGDFQAALHLDTDQKKAIKSDEKIIYVDTVFADLDLDGLVDRITCENGLHVAYQKADSSYRAVKLSDENGKIAVYDLNDDKLPDIIQQKGLSGLLFYANTGMKAMVPEMIPISEDSETYFAYNNYSKNSGINYFPSIDNKNITLKIDSAGVTISPGENWFGTAILSIAYEKENLRDTVYFSIIILSQNDAPVVNMQPGIQNVLEDNELILYKDSLLTYVSDVDSADELSIELLGEPQSVQVENDRFLYRPANNWNGTDNLFFIVSDGKANDTLVQQITVEAVNDAPQWTSIATLEFPEDELYQLPLTWFDGHTSDIETPDSLLRFHVYSGEHVSISAEGGKITLMPGKNWFGEDVLILTVSDGELADTAYWTITILPVNDAPELALLPDKLFNEDEIIFINRAELEKYAKDVETSSSKLKWQIKGFGKVRAYYNGARIRCTSSSDWFGTDSLELTVSDGELTASRIWRIHVLPVNDAPAFLLKVSPRIFLEDDTLTVKKSSLYRLVNDVETSSNELEWSLAPSQHIYVQEKDDRYYFYAEKNWFGDAHVQLVVNDGELNDTLDYALRVLSVNDKPIMQDPDPRSWNEDDTLALDFSYLEQFAEDVETKPSDMIWSFIPDENLKIKERRNSITLVPNADWNGDASVGLVVYDGGLRDTAYMKIHIKPVNDAPRWKALPDTSIAEDGSMVLPLAYVRQFVTDPDKGDEIKITYEVGDNFYIDEQADTLIIWPLEDWFGKEKIVFTATDGKKKVNKTWIIPVLAVNDAPYFTMGLPDSLSFKANSSDTILFKEVVYDVDNKLDDLVWEITPGRNVRYVIDDKLGGIIFFTENYSYGEDAITIRVTDGHDVILFYMPVYVHQVDRFLMANPEKLELLPNTPNPFKEYTDIRYSLPVGAQVSIKIYNLLGKEMDMLVNKYQEAQNYSVRWYGESESGMPAPSGVYLCRLVAVVDNEPVVIMQKMMLVR
ncbi:MAG: tandem-95 repeat protein [Candidatus Marinimicrobia bacterium]|nr:tandem-95 repeat protein [Candidatus Neomarinimicrobiota bacterium]